MRGSMGVLALLVAGCEEAEAPECEVQGVPTCSSSLVIVDPSNPVSDFVVSVKAESEGLDLRIECPTAADEKAAAGDIIWFCGLGRITLERTTEWPETLTVGFGGGFPEEVSPSYTPGLDQCGNLCNDGTITL